MYWIGGCCFHKDIKKTSGNQPEVIHQSKNEQSSFPRGKNTVVAFMGLPQIRFQDFTS